MIHPDLNESLWVWWNNGRWFASSLSGARNSRPKFKVNIVDHSVKPCVIPALEETLEAKLLTMY